VIKPQLRLQLLIEIRTMSGARPDENSFVALLSNIPKCGAIDTGKQ
jgi:hypothetical protein